MLLVSCFQGNFISILLIIPVVDRPCLALARQCREKKNRLVESRRSRWRISKIASECSLAPLKRIGYNYLSGGTWLRFQRTILGWLICRSLCLTVWPDVSMIGATTCARWPGMTSTTSEKKYDVASMWGNIRPRDGDYCRSTWRLGGLDSFTGRTRGAAFHQTVLIGQETT